MDNEGNDEDQVPTDIDETSQTIVAPYEDSEYWRRKCKWTVVKPKHIFLLSYPAIIRQVGSLSHTRTLRPEGKNGTLKRRVKRGNNFKNVKKTILRGENEYQASITQRGAFVESECIVGSEIKLNPNSPVLHYINEHFWHSDGVCVDSITYKNTYFCTENNHSVLIYNAEKTSFCVGIIRKLIVKVLSKGEFKVTVVYQKSNILFLEKFGVYSVSKIEEFGHVPIEDLADYYPLYLCLLHPFSESSQLYLSLRQSPLI